MTQWFLSNSLPLDKTKYYQDIPKLLMCQQISSVVFGRDNIFPPWTNCQLSSNDIHSRNDDVRLWLTVNTIREIYPICSELCDVAHDGMVIGGKRRDESTMSTIIYQLRTSTFPGHPMVLHCKNSKAHTCNHS